MNQSQKILSVASQLRWSSAHNMQASTGCIFDSLQPPAAGIASGEFFTNCNQRTKPQTNVSLNRFETNEAFLVEGIAIYTSSSNGISGPESYGQAVPPVNIVASFKIANRIVLKDILLGSILPQAATFKTDAVAAANAVFYIKPGLLIPPNVTYCVDFKADSNQGNVTTLVGCMLIGTRVLNQTLTSL